MRRLLFAAGLAMAMAAGPVLLSAQAQPQTSGSAASDRLDLDLYWEYETVSDPQISPDGAQIIYTRQWIDKQNDKRESSLWIMNADGSKNRFLTRGSNARWSPSGDRIIYTARGRAARHADLRALHGRRRRDVSQITRVEKTPTAVIAWSPDGTKVAFQMNVESKKLADQDAAAPEGAKWVETPRIVERLDYRPTASASMTTAIGTCSWCRPPAARRGS
jgi:dipeptidyl aminopeptidase/acylaminoacyl peptidase